MQATANRVTEAYIAECAARGGRLRDVCGEVDVPAAQLKVWRLLPRPLIAEEAELRAFGSDLARIFRLVTELPQRCFDGDLERFCAALRIDERRVRLMRRLGDTAPPMYGRSDMYHDGTTFRLLEFNIGSAVGSLDVVGTLPRALLRVPAFAEFATAHGLRFHDTGRDIAETLRTAGKAVASGEPVVAILEGPGGMAAYSHQRRALADQLGGHGLGCRVGEIGDLEFHRGKPRLDGTPIDVILRYFALEEMLAHRDGDALLEPVFRAHEEGTVVLWTPMTSNLFGNKGTLAMLSEFAGDGSVFSAGERAVIDRVLPWSRMLGKPGVATDAALIEDCLERREQLVLKPTGLFGGQGVVIGRETDDHTWRDAVTRGAAAGCLVQQEMRPSIELMVDPETGECAGWSTLWGAYLTPAGFAGALARAVPPGGTTVISLSANRNTRSTCVFMC